VSAQGTVHNELELPHDESSYYMNQANSSNVSMGSIGCLPQETGIVYENPPSLDEFGVEFNNNSNSEVNSVGSGWMDGDHQHDVVGNIHYTHPPHQQQQAQQQPQQPQQLPNKKKKRTKRNASVSSTGSANSAATNHAAAAVRIAGPRVSVQVTMVYRICDMEMAGEDGDGVLGYVKAIYRRSFVLSGKASVALGQGTVDLGVTISDTGARLLCDEEDRKLGLMDEHAISSSSSSSSSHLALFGLDGASSGGGGGVQGNRNSETVPVSYASLAHTHAATTREQQQDRSRRGSSSSVASASTAPAF
jgi:hypothetical protein